MHTPTTSYFAGILCLLLFACNPPAQQSADATPDDPTKISLPAGFHLQVVADSVGRARHIAVRDNGDIYVRLRTATADGYTIAALRDTDGDGRADITAYFDNTTGTGIHIHKNYLYYSSDTTVYRVALGEELVPTAAPEIVVAGFPNQRSHAAKPITFDNAGNLYVNIGGPSNACMEEARTKGSPGIDPCPQLEGQAGIWRFSDEPGQTYSPANRFLTGTRNCVALEWNAQSGKLYGLQHGRDQLASFWPEHFEEEQNPELPAEEFFLLEAGDNFGWPYCFYDPFQKKKVLAPEYGGDGKEIGRCADAKDPIMAFPGHWAPNDLIFYSGNQFPEKYRGGAFIAFHGSWNRAPAPQKGYNVVFVPFNGELPSGDYEVFADHFTGVDTLDAPNNAISRPCGLAQGPDGALYITDSQKGKIWRVSYQGDRVAMR